MTSSLSPEQPLTAALTQGATAASDPRAAGTSTTTVFPGAPFAGPPVEPGFALPRTGPLAFLAWAQEAFYQEMTQILGRLKTDSTAFWLLGGLSFLYGIIHAAGPGHGKVVIGSYMLANEAQVRRGIWLSFISAMIQSAVAVVFILIAASVLRMTSMAMSDAASWIGILSYGMIAALGLWLMIRHIFGLGHHHHDEPLAVAAPGHNQHHHFHAHSHSHLANEYGGARGISDHDHHAHAPAVSAVAFAGKGAAEPHVHEEGHDHSGGGSGHDHDHAHFGHDHDHGDHQHDRSHGHHHVVTADAARGSWKEQLGVVIAVGLRPCSGALVVLVFALSQGVLLAGIASVFLMGLGTFITVAVLATIAATAKGVARRLMKLKAGATSRLFWWIELAGAGLVFVFGITLTLASVGLASMGGL
jgi:ABC-type nickel/cobalt efflux system permease component RcnA